MIQRIIRILQGNRTSKIHLSPLYQLIIGLLRDDKPPAEVYSCPECGGILHVYFQQYERFNRPMVGATGQCENCASVIAVDAYDIPSWWTEFNKIGKEQPARPRRPTRGKQD